MYFKDCYVHCMFQYPLELISYHKLFFSQDKCFVRYQIPHFRTVVLRSLTCDMMQTVILLLLRTGPIFLSLEYSVFPCNFRLFDLVLLTGTFLRINRSVQKLSHSSLPISGVSLIFAAISSLRDLIILALLTAVKL